MSDATALDEPPLHAWADVLEAAAAGTRFDRIRVIAETASTQDAAARLAAGRPGLVVVAGRQTAGRGRHGRKWADTAAHGLAMTLTVDGAIDDRTLALAAGLAALRAAEAALGDPTPSPLGLKWPNDVIERPSAEARDLAAESPRKLAGVLVERRGDLALIGIGINVRQWETAWPPALGARGLSLRLLGSTASRLEVAGRLLIGLDEALALDGERLAAAWIHNEVQTTESR